MKAGISSCLGYFNCRYDGGCFNDFNLQKAEEVLKDKFRTDKVEFIPVCPEQLGGLTTPRVPAEIVGGTGVDVWDGKALVYNKDGLDVTEYFKKGAYEVLKFSRKHSIQVFILKENSPSCGKESIYSGNFDGTKTSGPGVTTALLKQNGITVFPDTIVR
jgi:uncharacterized protein YbbK (DUF523 family)